MAAISKREQARNESTLQELLRQPGNSTCADCSARNPAWASWNLGIFLCMRCASIHRKLGTHISKVKSLSMDKWTTEQVESMKQQGNIESNKIYNPKNKRPDIPLDADEVDGAMERFIRKKYQEKSLVDGRPEPPSRTAQRSSSATHSPQQSPNPDVPSIPQGKKHKFFGFSLRTSSKKDRPSAQDAFNVTPVEYSPTSGRVREIPDRELQEKIAQLNDMGFPDNDRNMNMLKRTGGDLERTVAALVKLGPSTLSRNDSSTPVPPSRPAPSAESTPAIPRQSNNPWEQLDNAPVRQASPSFGISFSSPSQDQPSQESQQQQSSQQTQTVPSANPWQASLTPQRQQQFPQAVGLEQQFATLQVSNSLFPNNTGSYTQPQQTYQDPRLNTMTPPVHSFSGSHASSPTAANPYYQQPLSSQSTGNNPFLRQQQSQPVFAPQVQNNPFLGMQQEHFQAAQNVHGPSGDPFALPPTVNTQTISQYIQTPPVQQHSINPFGIPSSAHGMQNTATSTVNQSYDATQMFAQQQQQPQAQQQSLGYGQSQATNPFQQVSQPQQQAYYQNQQFQQSQPQALQPQATGRYTKTDIMALFNGPSPALSPPPLAPVQEAYDVTPQQQSPAPSNNPYASMSPTQGKRSATMPVLSSMHSAGGIGSRNPFMAQTGNVNTGQAAANPFGQQTWGQSHRHASNESVSVNSPALMDGRHSPDAFASLSSRY